VVTRRIPARFGLNPRRDIPVLALMHRCPAGAAALNTALQDAITPARAGVAERRVGGRVFRVGDKVSQVRNNYDKGAHGVFGRDAHLRTEEEDIGYGFSELDELTGAFRLLRRRGTP
jgi:exodeoxyribonuclease V alpha subunit